MHSPLEISWRFLPATVLLGQLPLNRACWIATQTAQLNSPEAGPFLAALPQGIANGTLTVGDAVLFVTLMQQLYGPLNFFGTCECAL